MFKATSLDAVFVISPNAENIQYTEAYFTLPVVPVFVISPNAVNIQYTEAFFILPGKKSRNEEGHY